MRLFSWLFQGRRKPNYQGYATDVLKEWVDAPSVKDAYSPPYLRCEMSFAKEQYARDEAVLQVAQTFCVEVQKILGQAVGGEVIGRVKGGDNSDQYDVEFTVYPPLNMVGNVDAFREELQRIIHNRSNQARTR